MGRARHLHTTCTASERRVNCTTIPREPAAAPVPERRPCAISAFFCSLICFARLIRASRPAAFMAAMSAVLTLGRDSTRPRTARSSARFEAALPLCLLFACFKVVDR